MSGCEGCVNYVTRQLAGRGEQEVEAMRKRA